MKILFLARHFTYFRNFELLLRELAERGHHLHLAAEREESLGGREMVDRLAARYSSISLGWVPERCDRWVLLATGLRLGRDSLRYLDPMYDSAPKLRLRAQERVPRILVRLSAIAARFGSRGRHTLGALLARLETAIPRDADIDGFLRAQAPDLVLFTPLIGVVASPQLDYLQSAKALGFRTALAVWSWDHLSSKALIRTLPDRVIVWNETQKREAMDMHRVPSNRIVVTGAQCFDQWFGREPSRGRQEFCSRVALPPDRPIILYVCSALFRGSPVEAAFVERWIRALRLSGDPTLRDAAILVRPHPSRTAEWEGVDLSTLGPVSLWGGNPVDPESRADYFDSLYHSSVVVGLNTSAFLESAIVGRPVYTVLLPEFYENQEGTIHFHYLLNVAGGLLHVSRSLEKHATQLAAALRGAADRERSRRFVEAFIRPHGLPVSATSVFVEAVERLGRDEPTPAQGLEPRFSLWRLVLHPLAAIAGAGLGQHWLMGEREAIGVERFEQFKTAKEKRRQESLARKQEQRWEREHRRAERAREKKRKMSTWRRQRMAQKIRKMIQKRLRIAS